ncbi:MAG: ScpA family protein [Blastocatellales bacterium]
MTEAKTKKRAAVAMLEDTPERDEDERRDSYRVRLEVFEGPMDLLLYLIKKDEIEIKDIPIARITEQYLEYLSLMRELDIAIAGDFLVMASTLIYIKSKMLLPPAPKIEGEEDLNEDPRAELVERLLEYQKFKSAAQMLHSRGEIEAAVYTRGALETDKSNPEVSATVFDLLRVFREILKRAESEAEMEIHREEVTMAEKLAQIHARLDSGEEINVREIFEQSRTKRELILTFLAFLELVKEFKIHLVQRELFGEIFARKRTEPIITFETENDPVETQEAETQVETSTEAESFAIVEIAVADDSQQPIKEENLFTDEQNSDHLIEQT